MAKEQKFNIKDERLLACLNLEMDGPRYCFIGCGAAAF
jgi:hypothetical protein